MENGWLTTPFSLKGKKIWIAGHRGMVGAALVRRLAREDCKILTAGREKLDLTRQEQVEKWIRRQRPDVIILAAAKVGGIMANARAPADFLYENLMIEANIIRAAQQAGVEKFLFLGSSCIYPKHAAQPIAEEALLTGALEETNEAYAIAKISGVKFCEAVRRQHGMDFISAMPCNLYGPGDNFDLQTSHVIPALMRRAHEAKAAGKRILTAWGTGMPRREFLYVDDLADALVFVLKNYSGLLPVNIGAAKDWTIAEIVNMVMHVTGFEGRVIFDASKPDGTPRKLMDSSRIYGAGWRPQVGLEEGLRRTYAWYLDNQVYKAAA